MQTKLVQFAISYRKLSLVTKEEGGRKKRKKQRKEKKEKDRRLDFFSSPTATSILTTSVYTPIPLKMPPRRTLVGRPKVYTYGIYACSSSQALPKHTQKNRNKK